MTRILETIIEAVTHITIDTFCSSVSDVVLKDQNKLVRLAGRAGGLIIGEMVSEKATEWTKEKVEEAIKAYQEAAKLLEDDNDYTVT